MDPVRKLEHVFGDIARTRMADVPIVNPALHVEAVGFREWEGRWIGVLVTPWMINLVLLPGPDAPLEALQLDQKETWTFPSGAYQFMGLNEEALGVCHVCSLVSPVPEFATHDDALEFAREIMVALFAVEEADDLAAKVDDARLKGEAVTQQQVSRRDFLRMPFSGGW